MPESGTTDRQAASGCELCGRRVREITRHHLIPQTRHSNRRNKRRFSREEVRERIAWLCRPCHTHVHVSFSNKQLERELNTLEALAQQPQIQRFVKWIRKRPEGLKVASRRIHYR